MTQPDRWYDYPIAIETALQCGLAGFTELVRARHEAGYTRHERLNEWIIARRFWLDSVGNVWTLDEPAHDLPFVSARAAWKGSASGKPIATHNIVCERCGRKWELRNAHDYRHDRTADKHYHIGCHRFMVAAATRTELTKIVRDAGIETELLDVPNLYGSESYAGPWLTTITEQLGRITIGWRKRVISIEWERGPDGETVFADQEVTKDRGLVHAWSADDASKYLRRLLNHGTE